MSEDLSDFFKLISEDKKKKKEDFNEMVGDLGLDSLFNDIAVEKKRIKEEKEKQLAKKVEEEKKQKEKFDKIVGDMSLDSLFGDLAKVKKESKEEKEKEQKILSSFENFLTNKIDDIEEIKDEVVEDVNVVEEVKPEPEEVKSEPEVPSFVEKSLEILDEVSDPLTPLDQNFATLQDLQDHYRKFLVRIQQQLSSLGGGGIEDAPKTGGPYVRQGQKWVVSSGGGGGIGTDGSVNTTGIITASSFSGDGSALTGISGGIGTDGSVNTTGIITASSFSGDGSNLTGIISGVWTTSGSDIYYTTGKVGIGTDDPQQLLHLASTNPRIRLDDTDSGGYYTELRQGGSATYLHLDGDNIGSGNFRITADGGNEIFRFNDKGNVSIAGSTSSFDKNPTVTGLQLYYERDTQLATIASYDGTNGSEISIGTNDGTGDVVEAIRIKSDGNIGIGSDVPKAKLDVNGTVNVTGVSTFSGDVNFDNATLYVDSTNNRIGVGLNNPAVPLHMFGSYPTLKIQNSATAQYASASIDLQGPAGDERYTKILHGNGNAGGTETYFQIEQYDSSGSYVKKIAQYSYQYDYWDFLPAGTRRLRVDTSGIDVTGNITVDGTVDGRDVATDGTKLDGIEASADVTDATNVDAAGAVMNSDTSTASMSFVVDEDNMASNSATKVPTQQSVKAYVDANSGGGGGSSVWTTTGNDIYYTTGQVGIGSTQPTEELDVVGKVNISDDLFISGPDDRAFFVDAGSGRLGVGTKNPTRVLDLVGHGPFTADFQLTQHNSDADAGAFRLRRSRGTADSPTALNNNDGVGSLAYYRYDGSGYRKNAAIEAEVENGDSGLGVKLLFQTSEGTTSAENRLAIMPTGEIGIGKDNPDSLLTIQGTSNLQDLLEFRTSANRRLFIKTPATTHTRDAFQIQTENSLEFVIDSDLAMRIDHDANVGIGTTAPTEKFEVNGKAVITDDFFVPGPDDRAFFVDASAGRLGVGTKNPGRVLDLVGHGPFTADFQLTQHNDNADAGAFRLRRSRGTAASPTALSTNDGVGALAFYRYDGTDYRKNAAVEADVKNGDSNSGIRLLFQTSEGTTSAENRVVILPNGNVGIGKEVPLVALDVNGIIEGDVLVADGGTYDTGTESKSDAALVMTEDSAIYTLDNSGTRLRRLIEKQTDFIKIGQVDTSLVDGIRLYPGNAGSVRLFHGTTSESTGQKLETIGTGVTVYGDAYVGSDNTAGVILTSPDGTAYRLIVANDGTLTTTAV